MKKPWKQLLFPWFFHLFHLFGRNAFLIIIYPQPDNPDMAHIINSINFGTEIKVL